MADPQGRGHRSRTPAGRQTWRAFLEAQATTILAAESFRVDTVFLRRLHALLFIEHGTRRVHLARITARLTGEWATQQARNLMMNLEGRADSFKFLIYDRDIKLTAAFDAVFTAVSTRIIKTPIRAPRANAIAIAERWIASARHECLDRMLTGSERHLHLVLSEYVDHYNVHRPHRTLRQSPSAGRKDLPAALGADIPGLRRDRLGGLVHESTRSREVSGFPHPDPQAALAVTRRCGVSAHRVLLAWLRQQSPTIVPLAGASRPASIRDSAARLDLTDEDLEDLRP